MHAFLSKRNRTPVSNDVEVSGITWIELFVLFDLTGNRTEVGQHQKDPEATKRAEIRRRNSRCAKHKQGRLNDTMVITKPTLDEEIKVFKALVRHIFKHEVKHGKGKRFRMDNRSNLRRLNDLGISGHQPALMAFCQMTNSEKKEQITEAILKQRIANKKAETLDAEHRERMIKAEVSEPATKTFEEHDETILLRIARIAYGTAVRWKRETRIKESNEMHMGDTGNGTEEKAQYCSRLLTCTRCGTEQETRGKQLKVKAGFRAIHGKKCGKQERVHSNKCRCNVIWHHCPIHRIDPPEHNLGKTKKKLGNGKKIWK